MMGMMGMMGFWSILPLILVGIVVLALVLRPQFKQTRPTQTGQTPLEILKARYARDEISREEYEQMRRDLES